MRRRFGIQVIAWLCISTVLIGCSGDHGATARYPVRGTVKFKDKPTQYAVVTFHPVDPDQSEFGSASGICNDEGEYQLTTKKPLDGAVPGKYRVAITWRIPDNPRETETLYGKELLPKKYLDPKTSGLEREVEANDNEINFDLSP
jgi:hypothetical protein